MNKQFNYVPRGITETKPIFMLIKILMIVIGSISIAGICFCIFLILLNSNTILNEIFNWPTPVLVLFFYLIFIIVICVILYYFIISAIYFLGFAIAAVLCIISGIFLGKAGKVEQGRNALARNKHIGFFVTSFVLNIISIILCGFNYFLINKIKLTSPIEYINNNYVNIYSYVLIGFMCFIGIITIFEIIYFAVNIKNANKTIKIDLSQDLLIKQQSNLNNGSNISKDSEFNNSLFISGNDIKSNFIQNTNFNQNELNNTNNFSQDELNNTNNYDSEEKKGIKNDKEN